MTAMHAPRLAGRLAALFLGAAPACGQQWMVRVLHPAGSSQSQLNGGYGGAQVGVAAASGHPYAAYAVLWHGSAESAEILNPPDYPWCQALAVSSDQQVGQAAEGPGLSGHASLWSGTAQSWVSLDPPGVSDCQVVAVRAGRQAGSGVVLSSQHAILWAGTADSWVDLSPPSASASWANAMDELQQVGATRDPCCTTTHAALWSGSADSWIDLHPSGVVESMARAVCAGRQGGYVVTSGNDLRASLWSGSPESWLDLTPPGATASWIVAMTADYQVGGATFPTGRVPALWHGTPESFVNLDQFLPNGLRWSVVSSVWNDGDRLCVGGTAFRSLAGADPQAVLWIRYDCGSADFNHDGSLGTDADIEAFFACLGGDCCASCDTADFNADGDVATDADIEAFFRVLAGGNC